MSEQRVLYGEDLKRMDTYNFDINAGGPLRIRETGKIRIVFVNGKFEHAAYPFNGTYNREQWRILAAIEAKIDEIEERYKSTDEDK